MAVALADLVKDLKDSLRQAWEAFNAPAPESNSELPTNPMRLIASRARSRDMMSWT